MKYLVYTCMALLCLSACNTDGALELDKVKDPEKAMSQLYEGFQLETVLKDDLDYDENFDVIISGYDANDEFVEAYFIHNGDVGNTYTYWTATEYWDEEGYYEDGHFDEVITTIEDYFVEVELDSKLEDVSYHDFNGDGIDDAIAIGLYDYDNYKSIDAYIFLGSEEGYNFYGLSEIHYPEDKDGFDAFSSVAIKDEYFTIELGEDTPYWRRYVTFKFEESDQTFYLHKDGGTVKDLDGQIVRDDILTSDDFGRVYFEEFSASGVDFFSLKRDVTVSNLTEFLNALGSNKNIYIQEGVYNVDELSYLPMEAQEAYREAESWTDFYETEYYVYSCGDKDYGITLELRLRNLKNLDIIAEGAVDIVVRDEMMTVLTLENCDNVGFESIYMVHDVGGICGADVVDLYNCYDIEFYECTFDGSGQLAIYASENYQLSFQQCYFTNCTDGALEFYNSDAVFEDCSFADNSIWQALVNAYSYSNLDFYACSFYENNEIADVDRSEITYLFKVEEDSYVYLDEKCSMKNNIVGRLTNDINFVEIME